MGPAVQAFNDALAEFAQVDPKRLIVSYQIPIHDIDLAVAEVERVIALGGKSLQLPVFPTELGSPDYLHPRYTTLFAVIEESGLPICCHIGLKTTLDELAERDPTPNKGIMVPVTPLMTAEAFGMLIMGGVFERFPRLKVVFVEPGLTWVAWWLDVVDDMVKRQGYKFPAITELPSVYFHRNVSLTFIDEAIALHRMRDLLGVENLLWSTDFPHPVTSWPNSREVVEKQFAGHPDRRAGSHGVRQRRADLEPLIGDAALAVAEDLAGSGQSPQEQVGALFGLAPSAVCRQGTSQLHAQRVAAQGVEEGFRGRLARVVADRLVEQPPHGGPPSESPAPAISR